MKYVELYIKSLMLKQVQPLQAAPASIDYSDLPGLKSDAVRKAEDTRKYKLEYNLSLAQRNALDCKQRNANAAYRKEIRQALASLRDHLDSMLLKIGTYTKKEKANGFEVPDAE
jgi:hypothetical protein